MTSLLTRRSALLGLTSAVSMTSLGGRASLALAGAPTEQRLVVVIQRGAMDGLAAVVPYGDPALTGLRGEITSPAPANTDGVLDLGGFYGLHPALQNLHAIYAAGDLLPVHAVAGPYRVRSHFEAQDCMECGSDHLLATGWLNRVVGALPASSGREGGAIAIGVAMPMLLRGPARVASWAPRGFGQAPSDLYAQVAALSAADGVIGPALREGLRARGFSTEALAGDAMPQNRSAFATLGTVAGEMLARSDGPRIAALEIGGWDTHAAQLPRLRPAMEQFDSGLAALKSGLGPVWKNTVVLTMTEFGRTVRVNGTKGTDHGTASVAFLLGGAVAGGRVAGTWPGLGAGKLFEDRDLQPTTDLRSIAKGVLTQHLGLNATQLAKVFPDSGAAPPMQGLIRT
ncbi:MAG TPA: DUF1501 domain-containing protein [Acetobacteraceae bacterium]|nr:DUF1501 domain-containing protein [Acetobacteraceae bacterium]